MTASGRPAPGVGMKWDGAPPAPAGGRAALPLPNLLNDLDALAALLGERAGAGDALNAFLLAAGMQQVAEDHLHRDPLFLGRGGRRLRRLLPAPWGGLAGAAALAAGDLLWLGLDRSPGQRAAEAWLAGLGPLVQDLAAGALAAATPAAAPAPHRADVEERARALRSRLRALPASMRRDLVRLPSCFRSFDQSLEDVDALAGAFAGRWPDRERPLLVAGVRTSGSYLAPLVAAALRARGYARARVATLRPGQRRQRREAWLRRLAAAPDGLALLVDDPPRSWRSVAGAARELAALGFDERRTVLLLATFADSERPPTALGRHPAVLLPCASWEIWRRLRPDAVAAALARLEPGWAAAAVRPVVEAAVPSGRGHAEAVYEVTPAGGGEAGVRLVRARGVGLGYFGEHALAVAARLGDRVVRVRGLDRGVLYEDWPPAESRLRAPLDDRQAAAVAAYVAARGRALALDGDPGRRLRFRGADWQWAGQALGGVFGRASEVGRPLGAAVARRLLAVDAPAVIDNRTAPGAFAPGPGREGLVKCDFDAGVFTSDDYSSFDPVSDVALAAVAADDAESGARLRRAYEAATGRTVSPERWLLRQLVHVLVAREKLSPQARHVDRRAARLLSAYFGEVLLGGLPAPGAGPLCAIDLDGVLETMPLGLPATSPAGALALRALAGHGFRPVVATGRSLDEVRDRCAGYGLAGGVAEYGAVLYVHAGGRERSLLEPAALTALERLRTALAGTGDVHLDPAHRHSVRAFRLDARGRRRGLQEERAARALAESGTGGALRAVPGHYQTDFVAREAGKERALRLLAAELGAGGERPVALAVGDTASDLGMLRMARLGVAPGNAERAVRTAPGVTAVGPAAQAGLGEAVARLLGHRPGRCAVCAPPSLSESSRLLLDLLGVQDVRPWRRAVRGMRLALASRGRG